MSAGDRFPTDLEESAEELRSYLADGIPPLLAADAVGQLIRRAPGALTSQVQGWIGYQHQARGGAVRYATLAFHALRKLHLLGELGLTPKPELAGYLASLVESLVPHCPPEDREALRTSLERLRHAPQAPLGGALRGAAVPGAEGTAGGGAGGDDASGELTRELRRFALLLARIKAPAGGDAPGHPAAAAGGELVPALLAAAATSARDGSELGKYLQHLGELGVTGTDPAAVVRVLSRALPAWAPPAAPTPEALGGNARALHRFVDLAEAPGQRLERFQEVVGALVEEFNSGSLARAVALVHVAASLLAEKRVPLGDSELVRARARDALDEERLRELALDPRQHPLLRQLMDFFPGLRPEGLLDTLEDQPDRALRRLLLTLLELYGEAARPAILDRMEGALADTRDTAWFWQRNLVYLLHRIPCPAGALEERELEAVLRFSDLDHHPRLVGEAVIRLGQIQHEAAQDALVARLRQVEAGITGEGLAGQGAADLERLRALLVATLLRSGSATARRAVVEAALGRLRETGDAGRAAELSGTDLSADPDLVEALLGALRDGLPRRVLGVTLPRNTELVTGIVEGLSATPTGPVRRCFEELAQEFPREPFGIEASQALAAFDLQAAPAGREGAAGAAPAAAAAPGQRMEGDLQLFGLPNLLQSLAQNELTGTLTLRDRQGVTVALIELRGGALAFCSTGRLEGETAFFQLLERPVATSFLLVGADAPAPGAAGGMAPRDLLGLLMEGMRRYDEYQRARALVPDPAVLVPTGARPTSLPDETDGAFVRDLWSRVKGGATAAACEEAIATDAYRVRTLLAHWLAEGSVETSPFAPPPASATGPGSGARSF